MRIDLHYWQHWWAVHLAWWSKDIVVLLRRTFQEFREDHCTQLAAGISYYVLFSIFPLTILAVSISGLVLTDDSIRADVVEELFEILPLSDGEGREDLERAIDGVATGLSAIGLFSILGLLWAASGMMGAIRHGLDMAWDTDFRRPFLRAKLIDLFMVTAVGLLVGLSIATTFFLQVARRVSDSLSSHLGPLGDGAAVGFEVLAIFVPLIISFVAFLFIYKVVPSVRTRWGEIWPGALLAAVLFELVKNGFALYLRYFGNYDAVYGSLGAVVAFLFFVFVGANILLLGAEMAAEWPRVIHGHYDASLDHEGGLKSSRWRSILAAATGLVRADEDAPDAVEDTGERTARRQRRFDEIQDRTLRRPASAPEAPEPDDEAGESAAPIEGDSLPDREPPRPSARCRT
ncbi:MAG TPA: YihY/virulence factor BrkB family protein [Dehalococcoidia bacterium]|nr:YihY/virulence factor BrkB family protein [Dehalococcoidia bacterium]